MEKKLPGDLDFLEKLNEEDKQRFFNMTEEEQRKTITENLIYHEEQRKREEDTNMNQLVDRIATDSFQ